MAGDVVMVKGEVYRVNHYNPETGFCAFKIRTFKDGRVTNYQMGCAGISDEPPDVGTMIELYGVKSNDGKWGPQIKYSAFHITQGLSASSIAQYIQSFAKYLGREKSVLIAQEFGDRLEEVLDKTPEELLTIPGIGKTILANIVEGWQNNRSLHTIKIFLSAIGLPSYKIKSIAAKHGPEFDDIIKTDPYVLMYEGIDFSICDQIAFKLKIDPKSQVRVKGLILSAIRSQTVTGDGHLYVEKKHILNFVNDFNAKQMGGKKIDPVGVTWDVLKESMDLLTTNGHVIEDDDKYYLTTPYFYEARSAEIVSDIISAPVNIKLQGLVPEDLVSYYEKHEQLAIPDFAFSEKQADAIGSFVKEKVMVVTGPPGTGKTTIIKTFVRILENAKASYCLLAPTGIASKRLEQTSGKEAATIHRHLGYKGEYWSVNSNNPLEESYIIVDEFSMVSMELFYRLVSAVKPSSHIVFVGDVYQLPSVGAGNVLKDLIRSERIHTVMLDKVHRQAEQSDIVVAANRIKDGDTNLDLFKRDINADICFVPTGTDIIAGEDAIKQVCTSFEALKNITYQVITPRNAGDLSVDSINNLLQEALNPPGKFKHEGSVNQISIAKDTYLRPGDKVMVIKNNYNIGVFNGDVGQVLMITSEVVRIRLFSGESVAISIADARNMLKLAYAATVHKVQGTEFSVCVIPLLKSHGNMLLQRNLLYTALTRARKKVVMIGQASAIDSAIMNASIRNRSTQFAERIQGCVDDHENNNTKYTRILHDLGSEATNFKSVQKLLHPSDGRDDF